MEENTFESFRLGKNLIYLIKTKHVTQKKLCDDLGVPRSTMNGWTKGTLPRGQKCFRKLFKVARYFNVSLYFLLFGSYSELETEKAKIDLLENRLAMKELEIKHLQELLKKKCS